MKIYTIGFTKKSAEEFFKALRKSGAKHLLDIRLNNKSQLTGFTKRDDLPYFLKRLTNMKYLEIPNWDEFQHYKDRNPPWIKLHNQILENYEFTCLPDATKAHLLCIWMLASRTDNKIPNNPQWIANKIGASDPVQIDLLIEANFLAYTDASTMLADCSDNRTVTVPLEEERREEKRIVFDAFWDIYPNKQGKAKAKEKWAQLKVDNDLFVKIKNHIQKAYSGVNRQFIPHGSTYLNGKRWMDEALPCSSELNNKQFNMAYDFL